MYESGICTVCGGTEALSLRSGGFRKEEGRIVVTARLTNPGTEDAVGTLWAAVYEKGRFAGCVCMAEVVAAAAVETACEISLPSLGKETESPSVQLFFLSGEIPRPLTNSAAVWAGAL